MFNSPPEFHHRQYEEESTLTRFKKLLHQPARFRVFLNYLLSATLTFDSAVSLAVFTQISILQPIIIRLLTFTMVSKGLVYMYWHYACPCVIKHAKCLYRIASASPRHKPTPLFRTSDPLLPLDRGRDPRKELKS